MSYPPPGGYPYQPNQGGAPGVGFSQIQPGEGPGYSLYPEAGGGFPCPPQNASPYPSSPQHFPQTQYPAPPQNASPYPQAQMGSTYPQPPTSYPYLPAPTSRPYNPAPTSQAYPPAPISQPYSQAQTSQAYPSAQSSNMYPRAPSPNPSSPFNSSAYPPASGGPYAPAAVSSSPYAPPNSGPSPYSVPSQYAPNQSIPYPPGSGSSPYPPLTNTMPYGSTQSGAPPYSPRHNINSYQSFSSSSSSTPQSGYSASNTYSQVSGGSLWPYQERPTVRPAVNFDPIGDAATLRKAMKGFGTDEKAIIQVLGRRMSQQRQQILAKYQQSYGKDLIKDLKSELSGSFEIVVLALMMPIHTYLAQELYEAMAGIGTNEKTLIDILCTNDNNTLRFIKTEYQRLYKRTVEQDLRGDTSGDLKRLLVSMASASRDEGPCNPALAPGLAQNLYQAGAKKLGTDEAEFNRIMSCYSYPLLRCVFEEYRKLTGKTFEAAIRSELSGDFRNGMLTIYSCINNRAAFFAHYIQEAMKGFGTKDKTLIRIIVSRSEIDMGNIKDEYTKAYGKRLEDAISSETSGDYKGILLALIQG